MLPIFVLQLNLGIYLKYNTTDLSVLVDREVGGSSIFDGELELCCTSTWHAPERKKASKGLKLLNVGFYQK